MDSGDNILNAVKRQNNIEPEVTEFDSDICSLINGAFLSLNQLGVGPEQPFFIDANTVFGEFDTQVPIDIILNYISLKTKIVFDPPMNSSAIDAFRDRIAELEFRMNIIVDSGGGDIIG